MKYRFEAYSSEQGVISGRIEARNETEARAEVVLQGYQPLLIKPALKLPTLQSMFPSLYKVRTGDLIRFFRDMSTMLGSGANLLNTIDMLRAEAKSRSMRNTLDSIYEVLVEGGSLSEALSNFPKIFNTLMVSIVEVGEYTGKLGPAMDQLADVLEKEAEAKAKAIRTLMYPLAIVGLSMATLTVLVMVALPPLLESFDRLGTDVPMRTQIVMGAVTTVRENLLNIVIGFAAVGLVLALAKRHPRSNHYIDHAMLNAPIIGPIVIAAGLGRFSRTVSMLLKAGVSPAGALQLATRGCKNQALQLAFLDADESLLSGHGLASALKRHAFIPTMFVQLVMIGEESNSLDRTMTDAANTYEKELDNRLNNLLGLLEPLSTVVVGGIVGLIAFSMFIPIYSGLSAVE